MSRFLIGLLWDLLTLIRVLFYALMAGIALYSILIFIKYGLPAFDGIGAMIWESL